MGPMSPILILANSLGPRVSLCNSYILVSQVWQISNFMLCAISIKPKFLYILIRAFDRSPKESNFEGFSGTYSRKNWLILWEFLWQTLPKNNQ